MALVAGTRLVNFQASAATYLLADLRQRQTELPGKPGRASAIYLNKISMVLTHSGLYNNSLTKISQKLHQRIAKKYTYVSTC